MNLQDERPPETPGSAGLLYQVEGLTYTYPRTDRVVVRDATFELGRGEVLTVLGPNGAGKSTLLNCLSALQPPTGGTVRLCGRPLAQMSMREVARHVGYVRQAHNPVFDYTVLQVVTMGRAAHVGLFRKPKRSDVEASVAALEQMGIRHLAPKPYTAISGGERQQVMIARALAQGPEILLLDEPTAHLDFGNQLRVLRTVRGIVRRGYAVVMTTHDPNHAIMLGGRTAVLSRDGILTVGQTQEVLAEPLLRELYRTDVRVAYVERVHRPAVLGSLEE